MTELENVIQAYDKMHLQTEKLLEMPSFYDWILNRLSPNSNTKLLDIATGSGMLIQCAKKKGLIALGIDLSSQALAKAQSSLSCPILSISDGERLPFHSGSFDYVTNIGSLEHFLNPDLGINEIHRVLKDNGKAAIFLPNSYYLGDILTKVLLHGKGPSHNQVIERFATKKEWKDLLENNGLKVRKIYRYNFLFPHTKKDLRYLVKRPKRILGIMVSPLIPKNLSYSFLYICQKNNK